MQRNIQLFICLFTFLLISCTKNRTPPADTLIVALGSEPKTLDPRYASDANGMRIGLLLFNSLVKIGPNLNVIGDAAESWTVNNSTFEFTLKPYSHFSNGRPLSKEDILFSFEQYRQKDCPFQSSFTSIDNLEVNEKDSRFVVTIKLKEYSAKFLSSDLPVLKLLPQKEIVEKPEQFTKNPIGTGSYQLNHMDSNLIEVVENVQKPLIVPRSKKIQFKIIRDDFTRYQKMINGELDIAESEIPLEKVKNFEKKATEFIVFKYPGLSFTYLLLNLEDPVIKEYKARQAVAHAINRQEIIDFKLEGYALVATSILTPSNPFFNTQLQPIPYALQKAQELMNHLQKKDLQLTLKTSNNPSAVDIGKVIVNQLKQAGITAQLQSYEWGTFYGDIMKGQFQLATMKWVGAIDPDIYRIALHSGEIPPGRNRGHYKNRKLDQLLEEGLTIKDNEKRIKHYQEVQKIVMEELPIIPLWYNQQVAIVNRRVRNYKPAMNGDFTPLLFAHK